MVEGEGVMGEEVVEGQEVMGQAEGRTLEEVEVYLVKPEDGEGARRG